MVVFDFDKAVVYRHQSKPCIRIRIDDPTVRKEYDSLYQAAKDTNTTINSVSNCCERNKTSRVLRYRVKDWYFIYKDD